MKFDDAKKFCMMFRPVLPCVYNNAVLSHQPTPSNNLDTSTDNENQEEKDVLQPVQMDEADELALLDLIDDNEANNEQMDGTDDNTDAQSYDTETETENDQLDNIGNTVDAASSIEIDQTESSAANNSEESIVDDDDTLASRRSDSNNHLDENIERVDESVIIDQGPAQGENQNINTEDNPLDNSDNAGGAASLIETHQTKNASKQMTTTNNSDSVLNTSYQPADDEQLIFNDKGQIEVIKTLDDMEIRFVLGQTLRAIDHPYAIKPHDLLSNNLPFKENVSI